MGMGYGANYADVTEEDFLKEICPTEFSMFQEKMMEADLSPSEARELFEFNDYQNFINSDKISPLLDPICKAYADLLKTFEEKTGGLILSLCYHDTENGDRYDDVDGFFWTVEKVYQLTPAGEKFKNKIERKFWVSFG